MADFGGYLSARVRSFDRSIAIRISLVLVRHDFLPLSPTSLANCNNAYVVVIAEIKMHEGGGALCAPLADQSFRNRRGRSSSTTTRVTRARGRPSKAARKLLLLVSGRTLGLMACVLHHCVQGGLLE